MSTIHHEIPVSIDIRTAWERLSNLGEVHHLVSFLSSAEVSGDTRVCNIAEGAPVSGQLDEVILGVDEERHRVAYSITESPFNFTHHAASMQLKERDGQTYFIWTTDVKPDAIADVMAPMFAAEAEHIAKELAR
ncbi:MAG: SRPBCC family protein [Nannocystaceae bacterium]